MAEGFAGVKARAVAREGNVAKTTPGQKVALKADIIKKMSLKNLNSPKFAENTSVQLADRIFEVGRREGKRMDNALDPHLTKVVDVKDLGVRIQNQLVEGGFANTAKEAIDVAAEGAKGAAADVNIITPINKAKLSQLLDFMDVESAAKPSLKNSK